MRAHFVRDAENPLDSLSVGRIKARNFERIMVQLKQGVKIIMADYDLDPKTMEGHTAEDKVFVSFEGKDEKVNIPDAYGDNNIGKKNAGTYWLGWDTGEETGKTGFYAGLEDLNTAEVWESHNETIGECMNKLRKFLFTEK
jgi:hypothetical protein